MTTLRDKVLALANEYNDAPWRDYLALAVARMVAEECAKVAESLGDNCCQEYGTAIFDCAAAIRNEAEGL